ncbi:hypothetical protein GO730_04700 [Spirosoma sp. HMF3257]|uniref:Inosine/uridine-preferring nucleoside hydrolase domain-containing protein n=1 Tax=Spirosoma telluris TaxID=2183553 RepID=A0A327NEX8_9BACT|nr:hypothetical protein [Spirosoma telluris]RAI73861.1 hypothetical protein HMF3257_04670 [Spirosoma telluris]
MLTSRRKFIRVLSLGTATAMHPATVFSPFAKTRKPVATAKRIILDSDTATDDALAILMAVTSPKLKVEAITITCGNVGFEQQTKNALYTLQVAGRKARFLFIRALPVRSFERYTGMLPTYTGAMA